MHTEYPAIRTKQNGSDKWLVSFSAPATHIAHWGGVPEKAELSDVENSGFQRSLDLTRVGKIRTFLSHDENIIQNPLLCAYRDTPYGKITFEAVGASDDGRTEYGNIIVESENLADTELIDLLKTMKNQLEARLSDLKTRQLTKEAVEAVRKSEEFFNEEETSFTKDETEAVSSDDEQAFTDESFITDFWDAVSARIKLLEDMGGGANRDSIAGFSKKSVAAFLKPVVIVDGQHRLEGALELARDKAANEEMLDRLEALIREGKSSKEAQFSVETELSHLLPVSLLMDTNPAEHVFQFVVVNQKATPISRPLLGTIVSTSLSNDELQGVTDRLEQADIPIHESQAVSRIIRDTNSPFYQLVERGFGKSSGGKRLHWNVMSNLVKIFRLLQGGKLFHLTKRDYAALWRNDFLAESEIVSEYETLDFDSPLQYWSDLDGPWHPCFIRFFTLVKGRFSSDDPEAQNYWGHTDSNLFNKVSLHILLCDFFQYMYDASETISEVDDLDIIFDKWLKMERVSSNYFARNWKYGGKKDATSTKKQWSFLWEDYRKNPKSLPSLNLYGQTYNP